MKQEFIDIQLYITPKYDHELYDTLGHAWVTWHVFQRVFVQTGTFTAAVEYETVARFSSLAAAQAAHPTAQIQ